MELLQAGVDCSAIALWLGHESIETTQTYLHAHLALKEAALAKLKQYQRGKPTRFRPNDRLLAAVSVRPCRMDLGRRRPAHYTMLRDRGAEDLRVRAAVVALAPGHPYLRLPIQFATSLRSRILNAGLMTKPKLDGQSLSVRRLPATLKPPE
jgi:hypothetical protein